MSFIGKQANTFWHIYTIKDYVVVIKERTYFYGSK